MELKKDRNFIYSLVGLCFIFGSIVGFLAIAGFYYFQTPEQREMDRKYWVPLLNFEICYTIYSLVITALFLAGFASLFAFSALSIYINTYLNEYLGAAIGTYSMVPILILATYIGKLIVVINVGLAYVGKKPVYPLSFDITDRLRGMRSRNLNQAD
jgi:uncharacterized Tic20 family protein